MTTFLIILCFLAFFVWLGRLIRRREQARFRDVDAQMLGELRQEHNIEPEVPPAGVVPLEQDLSKPANQTNEALAVQTEAVESAIVPTLKASVLTEQQRLTLRQLEQVIASDYQVLANVRLADFITTSLPGDVSFLVCQRATLAPVLMVELTGQKNADVVALVTEAGLPHIIVSSDETRAHLHSRISELNPDFVAAVGQESEPRCPNCLGEMKWRAPSAGKNAGKRYWLCHDYPRCRGVVQA